MRTLAAAVMCIGIVAASAAPGVASVLVGDVIESSSERVFINVFGNHGIPMTVVAPAIHEAEALDVIRREKLFRDKQLEIAASVVQWSADSGAGDAPVFDTEIQDGRLRLMFVCCHPLIPQEAQTALALKTLCGFSAAEIAKAFLTTDAAIAKRLTRARQKIRERRIPFEIPSGEELSSRLDSVLQTLYLLFNEGYKASSGESLVREELCSEAIHLATLLAEHPVGNQPRTHALVALMLLNGARLPARVDPEGNILCLKEQDRSRWNRAMIDGGMLHLGQSAAGDELTAYHLQAGIAACHCAATDYESTDWMQILSLYDRLVERDDSPIVALNRAVAVAQIHGPRAGIDAVQAIQNSGQLNSYYLLYAVLGEFEAQLSNFPGAANHLRKALRLTEVKSEQSLLSKKLRDCEQSR